MTAQLTIYRTIVNPQTKEKKTFQTKISEIESDKIQLPYTRGVNAFGEQKQFTNSLLSLQAVCYHKKIYQPGQVTVRVQLTGADEKPGIHFDAAAIINWFKDCSITLTREDTVVADDYYIYKVIPEFRRDRHAQQIAKVTLVCYSRDHKLTLNPYSRMYVNKKLVGDSSKTGKKADGVIQSELTDPKKLGILQLAGFTADKIDCSDLRFLKYVSAYNETGNRVDEMREFIQPYLVQYNESFYDFLARTANRCGELLYHENGKLHIGTPAFPEHAPMIKELNADQVLAYRYVGCGESPVQPTHVYADDSDRLLLKEGSGLYAPKGESDPAYFYLDELPIDEYLGMYLRENEFTSFEKEWVKNYWYILVDSLNVLLNSSGWADIGIKLATKFGKTLVFAPFDSKSKNEEKNKKWITPANEEQKAKIDGKTTVSLYGSLLSPTMKRYNYEPQHNINAKFYRFISKCSNYVSNHLLEIEADAASPVCALGEVVGFEGNRYMVIEVKEKLLDDTDSPQSLQTGQVLVLAPAYTAEVRSWLSTDTVKQNGKKLYVDTFGGGDKLTLFCPPAVVPFIRHSGAQRAFVAKGGDPEGLGRVCIRYPWQHADDKPSPWIRMTVPFAPNDTMNEKAGFFFEPSVGDEVLVDYEHGNIEHPFIVGSLYTHRTQAPKSTRCIQSSNGHSLSFNDSDSLADFVTGIYPGYELLDKALVKIGEMKKIAMSLDDVNQNFAGGLSLSDQWGIYKIACSATDRNISIKSPFGDVSIGAFTGISISAPNGDIKIKGKNVSIEAGNTVKIASGKFIDEKKTKVWDLIKSGVEDAITNLPQTAADYLAPLTDLSFLRTIYEALFKPVVGTTTITAGRYMLLNAGGGKAQIPNKGFSIHGLKSQEEENADRITLTNTLRLISTNVDTWLDTIAVKYEVVTQLVDVYSKKFTFIEKPAAAHLVDELSKATGEIKEADLTFKSGCDAKDTPENRVNAAASLNAIRIMIQELQTYCTAIKNGKQFEVEDINKHYFAKILKTAMRTASVDMVPEVIKNVLGKTEKFEERPETYIKTPANRKLLRRMLAAQVVNESFVYGQSPDKSKGEKKVAFMKAEDYLDEAKWSKYVDLLDDTENPNLLGTLGRVGKSLLDELPGLGWQDERGVWDTCKQGEILFSDKGGKETINIVNGVLKRTTNKEGFREQVMETLMNL